MKKILQSVIFLFCILPASVWPDTPDDKVMWIKKEYKNIRTNLDKYKKYEYGFDGESSEGAGAVGYLSDTGVIKLIEVTYYGEMGKVYFEFYYSKKNTFFIFEKKFIYNTHFSMTEEEVKDIKEEEGVEVEAFDPDKTKIEEWRYYFYENNVIKTLGPKGTVISNSSNAEAALKSSLGNYKRFNSLIPNTIK